MTNPIVYGKALAQTVNGDNDDYLEVLDLAMNRPIVLYDDNNETQRGWMVPALSAILHLVHVWAAQKDGFDGDMPRAEVTWKAGEAARKVLTEKWDFVLRNTSNEEMSRKKLIKDLVMQYWPGIQQRAGEDLKARCQATPSVELTSNKLYGWDFMDLMSGKHSRRKQLQFDGIWGELTEDVLVSFGQRLGDVITPAPQISICTQWNPIPLKKAYLTATIDCLQRLSWERGGHRDSLISPRLTNKCYWNYRMNNLFTDCFDCGQSAHRKSIRCSKTPQTLDSRAEERNRSLIPPSKGAVVFGLNPEVLQKRGPAKPQVNSETSTKKQTGRTFQFFGKARKTVSKYRKAARDHQSTAGIPLTTLFDASQRNDPSASGALPVDQPKNNGANRRV